jgi:hypothetical protein
MEQIAERTLIHLGDPAPAEKAAGPGPGHSHIEQAEIFSQPFLFCQEEILLLATAQIKAELFRSVRVMKGQRTFR